MRSSWSVGTPNRPCRVRRCESVITGMQMSAVGPLFLRRRLRNHPGQPFLSRRSSAVRVVTTPLNSEWAGPAFNGQASSLPADPAPHPHIIVTGPSGGGEVRYRQGLERVIRNGDVKSGVQ